MTPAYLHVLRGYLAFFLRAVLGGAGRDGGDGFELMTLALAGAGERDRGTDDVVAVLLLFRGERE